MSAIEDLARRLGAIEGMLGRAREALLMAQDRHAEAEAPLWLLDGTHDPEALDALQNYAAGGAEMLRAWQLLTPVIDAVTAYRAGLEVTEAVERTPPSASHPSTTGKVPTDAARDRSWIDAVRERLPERPGGRGQTTGIVFDRDGNEHRLVSGIEDVSERARLILHNSDSFTPYSDAGPPSMVTHVETKYATMMRESGQTYGVIVLNNAVCNLKTGCGASARAILPRGSTLVIWEPGATSPVEIHGEARP
ncbi:DddA-like double-stranded DNA deaminase toxin [Saccharopolyspora cebuensis]|uniref:DddA-like double-stranded DNA deaminase toxin n=1 Tax=Saccharopolyspora cebuensis TaxID=418759 RepID=A0ABV4CPB1_9PSEU